MQALNGFNHYRKSEGGRKYGGDGFAEWLSEEVACNEWCGGDDSPFGIVALYGRHLLVTTNEGFVGRVTFGRHADLFTRKGRHYRLNNDDDAVPAEHMGHNMASAVYQAYRSWAAVAGNEEATEREVEVQQQYTFYCLQSCLYGEVPHSQFVWSMLCRGVALLRHG